MSHALFGFVHFPDHGELVISLAMDRVESHKTKHISMNNLLHFVKSIPFYVNKNDYKNNTN